MAGVAGEQRTGRALVDKPLQLALGEQALLEVQARELPNPDWAQLHGLLEPGQSTRHAREPLFQRIENKEFAPRVDFSRRVAGTVLAVRPWVLAPALSAFRRCLL